MTDAAEAQTVMLETRNERRKRERLERKQRRKNAALKKYEDARLEGFIYLAFGVAMLMTYFVCNQRILVQRNELKEFSGEFIRLHKTRTRRGGRTTVGLVYKPIGGRASETEERIRLIIATEEYSKLKSGDRIDGLLDGNTIVEFRVNNADVFDFGEYAQWNLYGMMISGVAALVSSYGGWKLVSRPKPNKNSVGGKTHVS